LALGAVGGWEHGLGIADFVCFVSSEIALVCGWRGAAIRGDLLVGCGGACEEIARVLEGGVVVRALGAKRVALEPLGFCSGDRRVGAGGAARADPASTRRRGRRPRAWGQARGPRTTRSRPRRSWSGMWGVV
jgi:hypothetical protein